jgi:hypothetical protein
MVSDELITIVQNKFKEGKRRKEIKDELWQGGYSEEDIDSAITKIQHDAIKKLPGMAWAYKLIDDFESRANFVAPHMVAIIMVCCIGLLLLMAASLYIIFDPLGTQATSRDTNRQTDVTELQNALNAYYEENHQYPTALSQLVPDFLSTIPNDPRTGTNYPYHAIDNRGNYMLCVSYELQQQQCFSVKPASTEIPVIPTPTLVPSFVPHAARGVGSAQ